MGEGTTWLKLYLEKAQYIINARAIYREIEMLRKKADIKRKQQKYRLSFNELLIEILFNLPTDGFGLSEA